MFEGINWTAVIEGIIIGIGTAGGLAMIYCFRGTITAWLRRIWNRLRRNMKLTHCFPRHLFEHNILIRNNIQLMRKIERLEIEMSQLRCQMREKNKQLSKAKEEFLILSLDYIEFTVEEMADELDWDIDFTSMLIDSCRKSGIINSTGYQMIGTSKQFTYAINDKGRRLLFDAGLLTKDGLIDNH